MLEKHVPDLRNFEPGAILHKTRDGKPLRITSRDGKEVLWPKAAPPASSAQSAPLVHDDAAARILLPADRSLSIKKAKAMGKSNAEIAEEMGVSTRTIRRRIAQDMSSNNRDFPGVENLQLSYGTQVAIRLALSSTTRLIVMSEQPVVKAYFEGYIAGFDAALAIICGSLRLDLSFLELSKDDLIKEEVIIP